MKIVVGPLEISASQDLAQRARYHFGTGVSKLSFSRHTLSKRGRLETDAPEKQTPRQPTFSKTTVSKLAFSSLTVESDRLTCQRIREK